MSLTDHPWNLSSFSIHRLYNGNTVGQQFGPKCCRGDKIGCGISLDSDDGQLTVFFTKNGKEVGAPLSSYYWKTWFMQPVEIDLFKIPSCSSLNSTVSEYVIRLAVWKSQRLQIVSTLLWECILWGKKCYWTWTPNGGWRRMMDRW